MDQQILHYANPQLIFENDETIIQRAVDVNTQKNVILKSLKKPHPSAGEIAKIVHTYDIVGSLNISGIIKPLTLERIERKPILVLEDFPGESLALYLKKHTLGTKDFLAIAISLANTLGDIHSNQVIHKDIKPENIIIDPATLEVRITDFGISTRLSRENPKVINRHVLEGTLNYISPEQTGRMNRDIDYRTDIYSLGIAFYEMITGRLPFQSKVTMELIHLHIAKPAIPPHQINPAIPKAISDIIMKCLAKMPEDRYHSAFGLKNDLEECLRQFEGKGSINDFTPGQKDIYDLFQIPQTLYGRNNEIELLLAAFERICIGRGECIMISGYAGIGKTSLVNEVQKPIVRQRGYFISGKFDQLKRDVPYSGLIQALTDLINQALTESETDLVILQHKLLGALHNNGQILIELIPQLELIIGKQPPVPSLGARENQNRLKLLFKSFIHVFSKKEHPLVIFLDDLQWAEQSTLLLIQELLTDSTIQHLLFIGSYREQEVSAADPLLLTIGEIKKQGGTVNELTLKPLTMEDIKQFTVDTVHCSLERAAPLAQVLHNKSGGNPFYLIQFIKNLHNENHLYFDFTSKEWDWDLAKIQTLEAEENVLDLLIKKIQQLPQQTQNILSIASAIGLRFDLRLLARESSLSLSTAFRMLWKAIIEDVIQPIGENYHLIETKELEAENQEKIAGTEILFEFSHDRLQQVAYSLLSDDEKAQVHYKIGQLLLQSRSKDRSEENIYEVISHLNQALSLVQNEEERLELAKMNLKASLKAKDAAAYSTAYDCISLAQTLLPKDPWKVQYDLTYKIFLELTECSYLTQRYEDIDALSKIILKNAKTNLEKGNLYIIKIVYYTNIAETKKAVDDGLECLALFGIRFSKNPGLFSVLKELIRVKWKLWNTPIETLEYLPEMKDPEKLLLMKVLRHLTTPSFIWNKNLVCLLTLKMMCLMLDHGVSDQSYYVYIAFGVMLELIFRDYDTAYKLGELSINVAEKTNNNGYRCWANFTMASCVNHWKNHLKTGEKYMHACYTSGMESGEVMYVSFISAFWGFLEGSYFSNLDHALKNIKRYRNTIFSIKSKQPLCAYTFKEAMILALKNPDFDGSLICTEDFDEAGMYRILTSDPELQVALQAYDAYRMCIYYLFGDYASCNKLFEFSRHTRVSVLTLSQERDLNFYHSLSLAGLYPGATRTQRWKYSRQIRKNQKLMQKWTKVCPENNTHRLALVEAEFARVRGDFNEAGRQYDISIEWAHKNQFYIEEGLASELAGRFYLNQKKKYIAQAYLEHAHDSYSRGAILSKVVHIESTFPEMLYEKQARRLSADSEGKVSYITTLGTAHASTTSKDNSLDLAALMQATILMAGEIHLESLLQKMMKILIENAGADRAFLLREVDERWLIEAEKDQNKNISTFMQNVPFEKESDGLSMVIIQYVIRTKQTLVLNDPVHIGMFTEDPYITKHKPKSILCFPLSHQGKSTTILYFENNATTDAFTPHRLDTLQLLSGQIAASLENATLYSNLEAASENLRAFNAQLEDYNRNLESKVEERTKELQSKNVELGVTLHSLKEMQKQVIQQEKLAALGSLTRGIAHEIRNPLNFINNFSSLSIELLDDLSNSMPSADDPEKNNENQNLLKHLKVNLAKIHDHSVRLDGIIASMLKYSKETKGAKEPVNLNLLLKQYLNLSKKHFDEKHPDAQIEVETHFDPNLKLTSVISQDIGRGLMNILDNAFYAVTEKQQQQGTQYTPKISITSRQLEDAVEILIRDNGFGIPKENREKLFHPFFTTKPTGTGTGLGLSIAHDIVVQEHSGDIKVNTEAGEYTEVAIHLPNKTGVDA